MPLEVTEEAWGKPERSEEPFPPTPAGGASEKTGEVARNKQARLGGTCSTQCGPPRTGQAAEGPQRGQTLGDCEDKEAGRQQDRGLAAEGRSKAGSRFRLVVVPGDLEFGETPEPARWVPGSRELTRRLEPQRRG